MAPPEPSESSLSSSSVSLVSVPVDGIEQVWPLAEPLLAKATARTPKIDTEHFRLGCLDMTFQLWLIWDPDEGEALAAGITHIVIYPSGWKVCKGVAFGGHSMHRWKHLFGGIEEWAALEGCDAVEVRGRHGWEKILPEYTEIERVLSRTLVRAQ